MIKKIYSVSFNSGSKVYYFGSDFECPINVTVIVETEKGEQFGKVIAEVHDENKINKLTNFKNIIRISTKEDYNKYLNNLKDADKALKKCKELVKELNLAMTLINASYTFNRSQLLFNFYADDRIDFRELAKKLASIYKTRIELRQIGARDKAREVGGVGVCGQKLCCARFLTQMESVSISMAKNQNLALNPSKINGRCNHLLCCLAYEDDIYSENRQFLPDVGEKIEINKQMGTVNSINILERKYKVNVNGEVIENIIP